MAANSCALLQAQTDGQEFLDVAYAVRLYEEDHCPPQTVTLYFSFGADRAVTGSWSDGSFKGDDLGGNYDNDSNFVVLHFGTPDHGYSLWGIVAVDPSQTGALTPWPDTGTMPESPDQAGGAHSTVDVRSNRETPAAATETAASSSPLSRFLAIKPSADSPTRHRHRFVSPPPASDPTHPAPPRP